VADVSEPASLYEQDTVLWSREQAQALRDAQRTGANLPIDWENVAEEIEWLGRSKRLAVSSHIQRVIEHLLKLEAAPARDPQRGWSNRIIAARSQIEVLLEDSPSLRREIPALIENSLARARRNVRTELSRFGEEPLMELDTLTYTEDQVLGDWWPDARGG
jgi:hypothetical protein